MKRIRWEIRAALAVLLLKWIAQLWPSDSIAVWKAIGMLAHAMRKPYK